MERNLRPVRRIIAMGVAAIAVGCPFLALTARPVVAQQARRVVPDNVGADNGDTTSSGVRGQCSPRSEAETLPLIALLPQTEATIEGGQTAAAYPTLWMHIPETDAEMAYFLLEDEQGEFVYETNFELTGQTGFVALPLDRMEDLPALQPSQQYQWHFELLCDRFGGTIAMTSGQLERIDLSAEQAARIAALAPMQQALAYAELGIWHDMVTQLADLYRKSPGDRDLSGLWVQMLQDAGLSALATSEFSDWEF